MGSHRVPALPATTDRPCRAHLRAPAGRNQSETYRAAEPHTHLPRPRHGVSCSSPRIGCTYVPYGAVLALLAIDVAVPAELDPVEQLDRAQAALEGGR
eukprot:2266440-Alexandrium_andersonii.AAC.1